MKRLLLAVMLCMGMLSTWAVPAKRISIEVKQPDGTVLTLVQGGDEHFHYLVTEDNVMVKRHEGAYYYAQVADNRLTASPQLAHERTLRSADEARFVKTLPSVPDICNRVLQHESKAQRVRGTRARKASEVPTTGEVHVPVLLVEYADVKFWSDDPKEAFEGHLNGEDYKAEGGYGSVKEFFEDQSEGKFMPKFEIIGPVTLSNDMEYYGGNDENGDDKNARAMVEEACRLAFKQGTDFANFDNDGDGYVDIVYIIYAGYGEASNTEQLENTIWPHQWQLSRPLSLNGVQISKYACNNELGEWPEIMIDGIGTFCHEFSHCLGLPDFYPTDGSNGFGMNRWSIMDYGCYNNNGHTPCGYTGYEKDFLGWKQLIELNEPTDVTLEAISEGGDAYKIVNDANPDEYYVLENHQRTKWDTHAPADGMLVIHVDYKASLWLNNTPNNDPYHQRMTIIPADNKATDATVSGDTYPGTSKNKELTTTSKPAARVNVGDYMGKDITDISEDNGIITFSFMKGALPAPRQKEVTGVTESGFTMAWDPAADIEEYEIQLDLLEENPFILDEDFSKVKAGNNDIGGSMDKYTNQRGWYGWGIYGLDEAIRIGSTTSEAYLTSPYLECDSSSITVIFTVKKSAPSDKDAYMVMAVADDEWGNGLYGYRLSIDNKEWITYYLVIDSIGRSSYLYIDTRDNSQTPVAESLRADISDIYVLPGDRSKELAGEEEEESTGNGSRAARRAMPMKAMRLSANEVKETCLVRASQRTEANDSIATDTVAPSANKRYYTTPVHTARTKELSYRFENLDGGLYRATVRSVKDGVYSRYSNSRDIEIVDSMLPQMEMPVISMDNDSVFVEIADSTAMLYYTLDGSTPTAYSTAYTAPFALHEKATVSVIARKEGHRRSDIQEFDNWFTTEGAVYRICSTVNPTVHLSAAMDGNDAGDYAGDIIVGDEVWKDSVTYVLAGVDSHTFGNATALRSVGLSGQHLKHVGDSLFHGCTGLNAVVWNVNIPIRPTMFDKSYHNLLVYLPDTMQLAHPSVDSRDMTLVHEGQCDTLILNSQYPFYAPQSFTASHVSCSRFFTQATGLGASAGWETISLPFDVQRITHPSKGDIAPFGQNAPHQFWLSELSQDGFKATTAIRANTPYLIAMPYNAEYGDNSLNGQITFTANNITVKATDEVNISGNAEYMFVPTYTKVEANDSVYALNVNMKHDTYAAGSVFAPNKYESGPFTAYILPLSGSRAPLLRIKMEHDPEVEEIAPTFAIEAKEGVVYITLPEPRPVVIYDVAGRRVSTVSCNAGVNAIAHLKEGIYLIEKTKVYVKR